jgi:hypothetical protein
MKRTLLITIGLAVLFAWSSHGQSRRNATPPYIYDGQWMSYTNQIGKLSYYQAINRKKISELEFKETKDELAGVTNVQTVAEINKLKGYVQNQEKAVLDLTNKKNTLEAAYLKKQSASK